jgi:hypothetical protein
MSLREQRQAQQRERVFTLRMLLAAAFAWAVASLLWVYTGHCAERVAVVGDSQAYLLMAPDALPTLARRDGVALLGRPVPGSSLISWALRHHDQQLHDVAWWEPTVIVVVLGSNDAYMGARMVGGQRGKLAGFVGRLSRMAPRIVWLGPPKLVKARAGCDAFYALLQQGEVPALDSRLAPITFWGDKLHPDEPGRRAWAAWAWPSILGGSNQTPK